MKKNLQKASIMLAIALWVSIPPNRALAAQTYSPLQESTVEELQKIIQEKFSQITNELKQKLGGILQKISPELANAVGSFLDSQLGELGLIDPQKLEENIKKDLPGDRAGYPDKLIARQAVRQQAQESVSALLDEKGQENSKKRIDLALANAKKVEERLSDINKATESSARSTSDTEDLAGYAEQAYQRIIASPIANDILKAIAEQQAYIAKQNAEMASQSEQSNRQKEEAAKQTSEMAKTLASIDSRLVETSNQNALQLEATNQIAEGLDEKAQAENTQTLRGGFTSMKNVIEAGTLY